MGTSRQKRGSICATGRREVLRCAVTASSLCSISLPLPHICLCIARTRRRALVFFGKKSKKIGCLFNLCGLLRSLCFPFLSCCTDILLHFFCVPSITSGSLCILYVTRTSFFHSLFDVPKSDHYTESKNLRTPASGIAPMNLDTGSPSRKAITVGSDRIWRC